tara:strand:- start:2611 stop:3060 length:450 start_codon:yes stop_codon:yes gene_type:complete
MFDRITKVCCIALPLLALPVAAQAASASLEAGEHLIQLGEAAEFAVHSASDTSTDLQAWCEVTASGRASLTFDGEHYIPLSEPAVGDIISLEPGETRRFDLTGSVEANKGNAYIAFAFSDVPTAMCFPGQKCDGATAGAQNVKVSCGNS